MNQTPDDSMDDLDNDVMDDSMLTISEEQKHPGQETSRLTRRRIEDLMERKRLERQLDDDFYEMDLSDDL